MMRRFQAPRPPRVGITGPRFISSTARSNLAYFDEPPRPRVLSAVPGPQTKHGLKQLGRVFDTQNASLVVDYEASRGN